MVRLVYVHNEWPMTIILISKQVKVFRTLPFIAKQLVKAHEVHILKISYPQALEMFLKIKTVTVNDL